MIRNKINWEKVTKRNQNKFQFSAALRNVYQLIFFNAILLSEENKLSNQLHYNGYVWINLISY